VDRNTAGVQTALGSGTNFRFVPIGRRQAYCSELSRVWHSQANMSDIFISYASEDLNVARRIAAALEGQGWSVFWDRRIPAGKVWREVIGAALADARCVVVLWSQHSVASLWVLEEADYGLKRRVLIPALIESVHQPLASAASRLLISPRGMETMKMPFSSNFSGTLRAFSVLRRSCQLRTALKPRRRLGTRLGNNSANRPRRRPNAGA
jgi:hypothetical protein